MTIQALLELRSIGVLTPSLQILSICILFVATTFIQYDFYRKKGKMFSFFPQNSSLLFAPLYEEIIFRAVILVGLLNIYSPILSLLISSFLFGLWHLKNIFVLSKKQLIAQIIYTGIILGPITCYLVLITGSIWIAVLIHFVNNLFAPVIDLEYIKKFNRNQNASNELA